MLRQRLAERTAGLLTLSAICCNVRLSVAFFSPLRSTSRPRSNGNPASISVANCRVKDVRSLVFTFPEPKFRLKEPRPFLAPDLPPPGAAGPGRFGSLLRCRLVGLGNVCREITHFPNAAHRRRCIFALQLANDFLAPRIQCYIAKLWHDHPPASRSRLPVSVGVVMCTSIPLPRLFRHPGCCGCRLAATSSFPIPVRAHEGLPRGRAC